MYDWETMETHRQKFSAGDVVGLNSNWSGYTYLLREFGALFPARVMGSSDGVVRVKHGGKELGFASQVLTKSKTTRRAH